MAKCDVLMLLDCCAGASAAPLTERPTNIKETIAACGFETWAPRPGPQSFTKTLIEVLKEWASQLPFSAAMLHSEILTRLKHAQPLRSSEGGWVESRRTPAYIVSTPDPHTASITLGRLDDKSASSASSQVAVGSVPGNLFDKVQADGPVSSEERLETLLALGEKGERKAPHVLLTVALEEDQVLDAASCARWLKQFPLLARYVSVEGVYRSYSTLLLLSVPVVLWDLLPDHPATQFVGYVRSRNLAPHDVAKETGVSPIPITGHSSRTVTGTSTPVYPSSLKATSGLSSLDSGYGSSGMLGPVALAAARNTRQLSDLHAHLRNSLPVQIGSGKRRDRPSSAELLGSSQATLTPTSYTSGRRGEAAGLDRPKRLIVLIDQADLNGDKLGRMCVLWYGYEVQRSQPTRRATANPIW